MTVVIPLMNYMCQDIRNLAFLDDKDLYGQFATILSFLKMKLHLKLFLIDKFWNVFHLTKGIQQTSWRLASLKIDLITKMSYITQSEKQFQVEASFWTLRTKILGIQLKVLNDRLYLNMKILQLHLKVGIVLYISHKVN